MKRFDQSILVTRPYLPDLREFKAGIDEVWKNQWLTNNGPMLKKFHAELAKYLQVPETNMALFNNGFYGDPLPPKIVMARHSAGCR